MAPKKETGNPRKGSPKGQEKRQREPEAETKPKQKIDQLAEIIFKIANSEGFFDPKALYAEVRRTDLAKSASILVSNLRLQRFGKEDLLRVPVAQGPDEVKRFFNLTARLRRQDVIVPFEDAVDSLRSPADVVEAPPEPAAQPLAPEGVIKPGREERERFPRTGPDFKTLYEQSNQRVLKLEGEVAAYKEMCFRLMETLKK
ncbi:MAG: hypothetical protein AB1646_01330 [Thermodesulfobacteriota bacterium]